MTVISEDTSMARKVSEYVEFFSLNSCGQCPPCKGGTLQLPRLLNRLDTGIGTPDDLHALQSSLRTFPKEYSLPPVQD